MRNLLVLVVVALAAWYGWKHWSEFRQAPRDEAVVENRSGSGIVRVRLTVGDQTFVRESIEEGEKAVFGFAVTRDATFSLVWQYATEENDRRWSGGQVSAGPLRTRHTIQVGPDGGVVWIPERLLRAQP